MLSAYGDGVWVLGDIIAKWFKVDSWLASVINAHESGIWYLS